MSAPPASPDPSGGSVYIHLPFCAGRCDYCDFPVVVESDNLQAQYVNAVLRELERDHHLITQPLRTLYFGGGTPSRLQPSMWEQLLTGIRSTVGLATNCEITCEANPESLSEDLFAVWLGLGVNRISLGIQSFLPKGLEALGRRHAPAQAESILNSLRNQGLVSWSVDLIYGWPGQTPADWQHDLERVSEYGVPHVSFYNLILHPETPFGRRNPDFKSEAQTELESGFFLRATDWFETQAMEVYELSNAAFDGHVCEHNLNYWQEGEWLGLGLGAVSCVEGHLRTNSTDMTEYLSRTESGANILWETASPAESELDFLMLALRTRRGVSLSAWERQSGHPLTDRALSLVAELESRNLGTARDDRFSLTPEGWLLHTEIVERLWTNNTVVQPYP